MIVNKELYNKNLEALMDGKIEEFTYQNVSNEPEVYPKIGSSVNYSYIVHNGIKIFMKNEIPVHGHKKGSWHSPFNNKTTLSLRNLEKD